MSDWPIPVIEPCVTIHPSSFESIGESLAAMGKRISGSGSVAYIASNTALFIPFVLTKQITVVILFSVNGAAVSGNIDMGIYDAIGTRIVSKGSTAQSGTNTLQTFDITDTTIGPGKFYLAVAIDNTTATLFANAAANISSAASTGMCEMANAFALPATATFATVTTTYLPVIGLSTRAVI